MYLVLTIFVEWESEADDSKPDPDYGRKEKDVTVELGNYSWTSGTDN